MDVGLVCDSCSAFNPMGAQRCLRCGTALSLDTPGANGGATVRAPMSNEGSRPIIRPSAPRETTRLSGPRDDTRKTGRLGSHDLPRSSSPRHSDDVEEAQTCPTCGAAMPFGHRFCFNCGTRLPDSADFTPTPAFPPEETRVKARSPGSPKPQRSTMFFGAMQAARAKLTLIRGDGLDGVSFTLAGEDHFAGREDCPLLFPDDPFLSPVHANFFYRGGQLVVRDESSINGVYVRIIGSAPVNFGTWFLVGEQVLEIQSPGDEIDDATVDGTYFFASPKRLSHMRVVQTLRGGDTGLAFRAHGAELSIGREGNDINFPDDPFISGHHALLSWDQGRLTLSDLGSKNGTFVRIEGEQVLRHGDYVFMGQQLLRVEIV